uniref:Uncharacterized protein n=1 Tax=Cyanothece sp. (strain PCC 7425 / ATCC 29141) TaxID=395961 RepID=B8HKA6_CYAP4
MDKNLARAGELKTILTDYVLEAEGELATALEAFTAAQLTQFSRSPLAISQPTDLAMATFLAEGQVEHQSVLEHFVAEQPGLSEGDRQIVAGWQRVILGLFSVTEVLPDGLMLTNWLTTKSYRVKLTGLEIEKPLQRLKEEEILLTCLVPVGMDWIIFAPPTLLGKLGKPKLAVAIGNFKQSFRHYLYSDAPELLEEAWKSVERYHHDFIDFFGTEELVLPSYKLEKKLTEFQQFLTDRQLKAAGWNSNQSLAELAEDMGVDQAELTTTAEAMGVESQEIEQLFQASRSGKMVTPPLKLPESIKRANEVTVLTHPHWGQMLLPNYKPLQDLLSKPDWEPQPGVAKLVKQSLADPQMNAYVWQRLANDYPTELEAVLGTALERPDFQLQQDLPTLLQDYDHPLQPELPEIASVPLHLHQLFQAALVMVSQNKPKAKPKQKSGGFKSN